MEKLKDRDQAGAINIIPVCRFLFHLEKLGMRRRIERSYVPNSTVKITDCTAGLDYCNRM